MVDFEPRLQFFLASSAPIGDLDFSNMDPAGLETMMMTFKPMFQQFYNQMNHDQSMNDFNNDDNGMFRRYFSFCDTGNTGILTKVSFLQRPVIRWIVMEFVTEFVTEF